MILMPCGIGMKLENIFGARSSEVRGFMKDSNNYTLEWGKQNMRNGGRIRITYDAPATDAVIRRNLNIVPKMKKLSDEGKYTKAMKLGKKIH